MIVVPMGGLGSRFKGVFDVPKPLIPIDGIPLIQRAVGCLPQDDRFIFIVRDEHSEQMDPVLRGICKSRGNDLDCIVYLDHNTNGCVETVLFAKDLFEKDEPILIADCDSLIPNDQISKAIELYLLLGATGGVTVRKASEPNLSYAKVDKNYRVSETRDDGGDLFSEWSTTGPYWWARSGDFVEDAKEMIESGGTARGEFRVNPVYNYHLKRRNAKVIAYELDEFHHIGSPDELESYLRERAG